MFWCFCVDKEWGTGLVVKSIRIHVCDLPQTDVQWMEMLKHISPNLPQEKCILILHTSLICTNRLNINNQFALMGLMNYSHDAGFDNWVWMFAIDVMIWCVFDVWFFLYRFSGSGGEFLSHSLSWSNNKENHKNSTKIWTPEDPRSLKGFKL